MMIRESIAHELPEPQFQQRGGAFATVISRDWLTKQVLAGLNLNKRQATIIEHIKVSLRITNSEYQHITGATPKTASRDLDELVGKGRETKKQQPEVSPFKKRT
jgi:ATP-dependent DNA helicase RecG